MSRRSATHICLTVIAIGGFALSGCEKWRLDAQVKELCAKDGGIKVYETVKVPPGKFDKFGIVRVPMKKDAKPEDEYYYEWEIQYFKQGNPEMWRNHFTLYRAKDKRLLGEATGYSRRGGDLPSPMHESSFGCPTDADISVLKQRVFKNTDEEQAK